jgi:NADPH:quinone reductase-like Zn-dependent oxidoreductase
MMPAMALWITAPGTAELRTVEVADTPGYVGLRTRFSGISRGTESLVFQGRIPESEWQRMRCPFQEGEFPAPVKYGYALVGQVEEGPDRGRWAFALHPHQNHCRLPPEALHWLPAELPPRRAVLAANMETAVNALWDGGVRVGDRVCVVGGGVVGLLVAYLCARIPGTSVTLVDPDAARESVARTLGLHWADPALATGDDDVVFHASVQPTGLVQALELAGFEARVVELSWYGDGRVDLPLGEAFHARRLQIRASQVGTVAGARRARWSADRRLALALALLCDPALDTLLEPNWSFADAPRALARVCGASGALCQVLSYD